MANRRPIGVPKPVFRQHYSPFCLGAAPASWTDGRIRHANQTEDGPEPVDRRAKLLARSFARCLTDRPANKEFNNDDHQSMRSQSEAVRSERFSLRFPA